MSERRVLFALFAACTLLIGVGVAEAVREPASPPQAVLAADPAQGHRTVDDVIDELVRTLPQLQPQPPSGSYAQGKALGMTDDEVCALAAEAWAAQMRLHDQMLATVPPPPGYDPTNPKGVVNIHRRLGAPDYYAEGKALGMTDSAACAYAAQAEAAQPPLLPTGPAR